MKIITAILLVLCVFLVYYIYFGHNGVQKYKKMELQMER